MGVRNLVPPPLTLFVRPAFASTRAPATTKCWTSPNTSTWPRRACAGTSCPWRTGTAWSSHRTRRRRCCRSCRSCCSTRAARSTAPRAVRGLPVGRDGQDAARADLRVAVRRPGGARRRLHPRGHADALRSADGVSPNLARGAVFELSFVGITPVRAWSELWCLFESAADEVTFRQGAALCRSSGISSTDVENSHPGSVGHQSRAG